MHDPAAGETLPPRLPKLVEADPRFEGLVHGLRSRAQRLWPGGELRVATAARSPAVEAALLLAQREGRLVRGLEGAQAQLEAEERGMTMADRSRSKPRGERISRLLVLSNDGAERFYRHVEALLRRHGSRVLAIRFEMDAAQLGGLLFGPDRVARLVLLERKESVSSVLLALAEEWGSEAAARLA